MRFLIVACLAAFSSLARAGDLIPLNDLGPAPYRLGYFGGLYENGINRIPADHLAAGMEIAQSIQPLDENGQPSPTGKVALLTVGMGDTSRIVFSLMALLRDSSRVRESVLIANAATEDVSRLIYGYSKPVFDRIHDSVLLPAGAADLQVQVAWLQISTSHPTVSIIRQSGDGYYVKGEISAILQSLRQAYPNLRIAYLSSRPFAGYSDAAWNAEPFAYETGLSVRWVILEQIAQARTVFIFDTRVGTVSYLRGQAPWVAWGPYLWANGTSARSDGLTWQPDDYEPPGEFLSEKGAHKAAAMLLNFLLNEPTARNWFLQPGGPGRPHAVRH